MPTIPGNSIAVPLSLQNLLKISSETIDEMESYGGNYEIDKFTCVKRIHVPIWIFFHKV